MNSAVLTVAEVDALAPETVILTLWVGSNDVISYSGDKMVSPEFLAARELPAGATLSQVLDVILEGESGNSFTLAVFRDNRYTSFYIDP